MLADFKVVEGNTYAVLLGLDLLDPIRAKICIHKRQLQYKGAPIGAGTCWKTLDLCTRSVMRTQEAARKVQEFVAAKFHAQVCQDPTPLPQSPQPTAEGLMSNVIDQPTALYVGNALLPLAERVALCNDQDLYWDA